MDEEELNRYFERQHEYLNRNIQKIIEIYSGKFVVIYDSMIVDSDSNEFELAKRTELRQQFDFTLPALITRVSRTLEEHIETERLREQGVHLDSPECEFPHFASPEIVNQDYS